MNCIAVRDTITTWLNKKLRDSNQQGFIIGVSGGVDSALVSTLCAMTNYSTCVLSMPIYQAPDQLSKADAHIQWLKDKFINVMSDVVNLTNTFESLRTIFPTAQQNDELAMANMRSRLRMVALYAYANHHNFLVAGTGNLVEDFGVGFFTKYGDGGVDLSPIGDLSKSQVWQLAAFLGVSDDIVKAKPTDGLWADNRGDEDAIGATYTELEWAIAYCENKIDCNLTDRQKVVLKIYHQRHDSNQHKMNPIPICKIPQIIL